MESVSELASRIGWIDITLILMLFLMYMFYSWISVYDYWKRRKVPYLKPSFPFGNVKDVLLMKKNFSDSWMDVYRQFGDLPFGGIFSVKLPVLVIKDPELIKSILTKDFSHFTDHGWFTSSHHEPLLNNLFHMEGNNWRKERAKLMPAFTNRKMKMIFPIMNECAQQLKQAVANIHAEKGGTFEAKQLMMRYTLDVTANTAFGLSTASVNNPECEVFKIGRGLFRRSLKRIISNIILMQSPKLYSLLKLHFLDYEACESFAKLITDTITYREANGVVRYDLLDLMIRLKNHLTIDDNEMFPTSESVNGVTNGLNENKRIEAGITHTDLLSHALSSFLAGFEGTSTALALCLFELAKRPGLQTKLQSELDEALERHGDISYQLIQELQFLDRVVDEVLRMYPPLPMLDRICVKSYRIPGTDVVIDKGCKIVIPTYAVHHDPKYYPEPFEFDPDRFLEDNVKSRPKYTYLPFGDGPRLCIGFPVPGAYEQCPGCPSLTTTMIIQTFSKLLRNKLLHYKYRLKVAKMTIQLALATFFSEFNCKLNARTPDLSFACGEVLTTISGPLFIDVSRRTD